ncbi:MAG: ABC transporter permease [Halanaeroarchaeum sp.]
MDNRLRIARRTIGSLRSEKTILLAIAIQLFVAAFSSFMVVGLVSLSDPGATQGEYQVTLGVSGEASEELLPVVNAGDARKAQHFDSRAAALEAYAAGRVDGVLHAEYTERGRILVEAIAPEEDFRSTLVVVQIKDTLTALERVERMERRARLETPPLPIPQTGQASPYFQFTYAVLLPVLVVLPAFISGSIAADSLAEEIERGTLELLRVAPVTAAEVVDGKALAMVAIAPAQAATWLGLLALQGTTIARPVVLIVLVTAFAIALVALGAGLAITLRERSEAQLLYSLAALLLFGAAMLAPESPPDVVAKLAVGTETTVTLLTVFATVIVAVVGYALVRVAIQRMVGRA